MNDQVPHMQDPNLGERIEVTVPEHFQAQGVCDYLREGRKMPICYGLVLAGGAGTRLGLPISKELIPFRLTKEDRRWTTPLKSCIDSFLGFQDVMIFTRSAKSDIIDYVAKETDCHLLFQKNPVGDTSAALSEAFIELLWKFPDFDYVLVRLGDTYIGSSFDAPTCGHEEGFDTDILVYTYQVEHPQHFGVVDLATNTVQDKPETPQSNRTWGAIQFSKKAVECFFQSRIPLPEFLSGTSPVSLTRKFVHSNLRFHDFGQVQFLPTIEGVSC